MLLGRRVARRRSTRVGTRGPHSGTARILFLSSGHHEPNHCSRFSNSWRSEACEERSQATVAAPDRLLALAALLGHPPWHVPLHARRALRESAPRLGLSVGRSAPRYFSLRDNGDGGNRTHVRGRVRDGVYERSRLSGSRLPLAVPTGLRETSPLGVPAASRASAVGEPVI